MRNVVINTSSAVSESIGHDIACFERMTDTLIQEALQGKVEQVTLVVEGVWDVVEIEKYAMLVRQINAIGVILEVFVTGRVNLATLDMFSAGLNRQGSDARAKRTLDEKAGVIKISSGLQLTLDAMPQDWSPMSMVSSLLYSLGDDIGKCSAEDIYDLYSKDAFCEVEVDLVSENYLARQGGESARLLSRADRGWVIKGLSLAQASIEHETRLSKTASG